MVFFSKKFESSSYTLKWFRSENIAAIRFVGEAAADFPGSTLTKAERKSFAVLLWSFYHFASALSYVCMIPAGNH